MEQSRLLTTILIKCLIIYKFYSVICQLLGYKFQFCRLACSSYKSEINQLFDVLIKDNLCFNENVVNCFSCLKRGLGHKQLWKHFVKEIRKLVFSCSFNKFIDDYRKVCLLNNCKAVSNFNVSCEGKWCSNTFNTKLFAGLNHRKFQL